MGLNIKDFHPEASVEQETVPGRVHDKPVFLNKP